MSSKRIVPRLVDLTDDETIDLWITAKHVGSKLEPRYGARSLTFGIQVKPSFLVFIGLTLPCFLKFEGFSSFSAFNDDRKLRSVLVELYAVSTSSLNLL